MTKDVQVSSRTNYMIIFLFLEDSVTQLPKIYFLLLFLLAFQPLH